MVRPGIGMPVVAPEIPGIRDPDTNPLRFRELALVFVTSSAWGWKSEIGRAGTGEVGFADFPYGDLKLTATTKFGAAPETLAVAE